MNVWTYWEGDRPVFIDVCLSTASRACAGKVDFHLVTPDNLKIYLPDGVLDPRYAQLPQPALRADAIRAALLATHGGWWWDADTVVFCDPLHLPAAPALYMTWTKLPRRVLNGYIYLEKTFAEPWLDSVNKSLRDGVETVRWCSLGEELLTNRLTRSPEAVELPRRLFLPIDIDADVKSFFLPGDFVSYLQSDTVCFGLNFSWFMYHRREEMLLGREFWAKSPLLVHRLLDYARNLVL